MARPRKPQAPVPENMPQEQRAAALDAQRADPRRTIVRTLERVGQRHGLRQVWEDWIEALALAFANALGNAEPRLRDETWHAREARYHQLVRRYAPDEWREVASLIGPLTDAAEAPGDLLGELYMSLELGNDRAGQFFTPWHLCLVNARLLVGDGADLQADLARRGFITVDDPACGSATMLLAFAEVVRELGLNPQMQVWFHGTDISSSAAHLAYVNLALRGLPGVIVHGDTLRLETFGTWETPAHTLGGWRLRLAGQETLLSRALRLARAALTLEVPGPAQTDHSAEQIFSPAPPDLADPTPDPPQTPEPAPLVTGDVAAVTATAPATPAATPETPAPRPADPPAQLSLL